MNIEKVKKDLIARGMREEDFKPHGNGVYVIMNKISRDYFAEVGMQGVGAFLSFDDDEPSVYDVRA